MEVKNDPETDLTQDSPIQPPGITQHNDTKTTEDHPNLVNHYSSPVPEICKWSPSEFTPKIAETDDFKQDQQEPTQYGDGTKALYSVFLSKDLEYKTENESSRESDSNTEDLVESPQDEAMNHLSDDAQKPAGDLGSDVPLADVSDDSNSFDPRRTRRKRKTDSELCCPVCGITVRMPEIESHFSQEVEKLNKLPGSSRKLSKECPNGINTTFVRVKSNRENRLSAKVDKYAAKAKKEIQCPVCGLRMSGCEEEANKHVALCFQNDDTFNEHVNVNDVYEDDDDESFEEYEIGDQTRIRAISGILGGYRSLEGQTMKRHRSNEDEDFDIDIDDTMAYGQPQYTELDVIPNSSDGDDEARQQLRKAVLMDPTVQRQVGLRKWSESGDAEDSKNRLSETSPSPAPNENSEGSIEKNESSDQIVSSLKEKIKDLEDQTNNVKCLICMESYTKPVVSTTCWHVHCEECWLMTMGVKKLCPQCNMIVFPSDLRKIYL